MAKSGVKQERIALDDYCNLTYHLCRVSSIGTAWPLCSVTPFPSRWLVRLETAAMRGSRLCPDCAEKAMLVLAATVGVPDEHAK